MFPLKSILSKSGFDLYPYKSNFFDVLQDNLIFTSIYNSDQLENNKFLLTLIYSYKDEIVYKDSYTSKE